MINPVQLSQYLGQPYPPTKQQAAVIGAPLASSLVVAGAGAGKTETMAARVVWLVANGLVAPEQVLGLTFTNKAAQQLAQRISGRLTTLRHSAYFDELDALLGDEQSLRAALEVIAPTVATYDSFAGRLVREFGLLLPVEPSARIISRTELMLIAQRVLKEYRGPINSNLTFNILVSRLVDLNAEMEANLVEPQAIREETHALFAEADAVPTGRESINKTATGYLQKQEVRLQLLPVVEQFRSYLREEKLMTFNQQMALAARLASEHPEVGAAMRERFSVVLLDEYQDTSYAQRVLLSALFAESNVTAVGDPMQSIYGWRGGSASNLERFPEDFPHEGKPAKKYELTTSFRNPSSVLTLANQVAASILGSAHNPKRLVQPLEPLPNQGPGSVALGAFPTREEEITVVADALAQRYYQRESDEPFTAAVLMRKQRDFGPMEQALRERGVPVEVVGLSGLLTIPEVADMLAIATMLVDPADDRASIHVLGSAAVGLDAADIKALQRRAAELGGSKEISSEGIADPLEKLKAQVQQVLQSDQDNLAGLADAVADIGSAERIGLSPEGELRVRDLAAKLRFLRTTATNVALPDVFANIERVFNIRTEVLQRPEEAGRVVGTTHLDRFAEVVEEYSRLKGATLPQFLQYVRMAIEHDKGLEPGEVEVHADRVQILTVHKSKGLEWQHVAVMHCDHKTYESRTETWLKQEHRIPSALLGDADEDDESMFGSPVLSEVDTETKAAFARSLERHREAFKQKNAAEAIRLFYVAMTRAETSLLLTCSEKPPFEAFEQLHDVVEPDAILRWEWTAEDAKEQEDPPSAVFPQHREPKGADEVMAALEALPELIEDGDLFQTWEQDVSAIIQEHEALDAPSVEVALPRELTATDLVSLRDNPERFARRKRRPVPFKPNEYAKRGTAFHEWIERQFGQAALLDEQELALGQEFAEENLDQLKEHFLASEWLNRTPVAVEQPFEVAIGRHVLRGRMDAVFAQDDGYLVVDWKTGQLPTAQERKAVEMQLAVYRLAWAKLQGIDPEAVQAAFYYVTKHELLAPQDLPGAHELEQLLEAQNPKR
ncbi:ATP-dependent helicase [Corynebacterium pelargi]|uniref:DNA 3'-5' helicase n=1 Tax=Corynebacterium pelargi TaxID=1471400 RepID=A0A410WAA2_9CORY|nr:UvrD-helicase domain-containing protein [Corynebacterium pelargi]QAU52903.1 ATP-dependent DNA helicase PcrA [Corynebacterium pelargi]GGG76133.1 helicase [Corynebacterium pelargi]